MKAEQFLKRHGMHISRIDSEKELDRFLSEMETVRLGGEGSLEMIPTHLGDYHAPDPPEKILVMDIGGTNVRSSVLEIGPHGMLSSSPLAPFLTPGLDGELTADTFFRRIADGVSTQSLWDEVNAIPGLKLGICFSFALNPVENRDAEVTAGAKQINVPDLAGRRIGESFYKALQSLGKPSGQIITVINDASAAALGGRSLPAEKQYSGYLGFIYGTGTNISYCTKSGEVINVESGAYCSFPAGDIDDEYDHSLLDTGHDRFEKMVSAGYLGGLTDMVLRHAAEEGDLSESVFRALYQGRTDGISPKEISAFLKDPLGDGRIARAAASEADREFLSDLFDLLLERSALFCSISLTAAMLKAEAGFDEKQPAFITAEGSAFMGLMGFRRKLEARMDLLAGQAHGLHYEFHTVPDAILRGTAVACLSS